MSVASLPPSIFLILERNIGKKLLVILEPSYGFEGILASVKRTPPGVWLSDANAVTLRATIAQPIPQVSNRIERSEIFINLNAAQRIEVLHKE